MSEPDHDLATAPTPATASEQVAEIAALERLLGEAGSASIRSTVTPKSRLLRRERSTDSGCLPLVMVEAVRSWGRAA